METRQVFIGFLGIPGARFPAGFLVGHTFPELRGKARETQESYENLASFLQAIPIFPERDPRCARFYF